MEIRDVTSYIEANKHIKLEDKEPIFEVIIKYIQKFKIINKDTKILEIGSGTGWFPILCKKKGFICKGLEINPHLVEYAQQFGLKYGIEPDIELGNIEKIDIGTSKYDIIVACSTFEHIKHWQEGIKKVFNALKPGGIFYFSSTNKFSLKTSEYNFPFYGWLPNSWRYCLRIFRQGEKIMEWGIDFNQFTYFQLRRFFKNVGFSKIWDPIDSLDPYNLNSPKLWKKIVLKILRNSKPLKDLSLLFADVTEFICIK